MPDESKKELVMTRVFDAPRELVFKAWTDPHLITKWWGPRGVFIPVCEVDAKPGGNINIVMEADETLGKFKGTKWPMEGKFEEIEKPSKIVFTANAVNEGRVILEHKTTVTFEEENGKTTMKVHVVVTKALPGSEFAIKGMEQGWREQFDKLVEFIRQGGKEGEYR
ncbi:SRPBCC domain-containing protein [Patescibacteria group bacterium]|nr:SRPBCC domain-containing protein [Patescibacteria group bacterium]MCL5797308.1 SRPBCC domain-containing protein [Patescibacteria group bacterium]